MKWTKRNYLIILSSSFALIVIVTLSTIIPMNLNKPFTWEVVDPDEYGFDSSKLEVTYEIASNLPFLRSLLIVRHGKLVVEWYFNDGSEQAAFHIHSASKSFISVLIGIAFDKGILQSVDQKLMDFLPEYEYLALDPRVYDITIDHLLKMRAGFNFNDSVDDWNAYAYSSDWVKHALELPFLHNPGEDFHYATPQSNLLSVILTKAANMSTRDFAEEHLFRPLRISIDYWYQDPQGYFTGGHEMYFIPRDLARFGLFYLNNGTFNREQILSNEWIQNSVQDYSDGRIVEGMNSIFYEGMGYGYQMWIQELYGYHTISARGHGGQFVICVPELDVVVVTTASGTIQDTYPNQLPRMVEFVEFNVLPTIISD